MKISPKLVTGAVVLASILFVAVFFRYETRPGQDGIAYQVDRFTGKTWLIAGSTRVPVESDKPVQPHGDLVRQLETVEVTGLDGVRATLKLKQGVTQVDYVWTLGPLTPKSFELIADAAKGTSDPSTLFRFRFYDSNGFLLFDDDAKNSNTAQDNVVPLSNGATASELVATGVFPNAKNIDRIARWELSLK